MAEPATNPEQKVSRYRSQRQKAQRIADEDATEVPQLPANVDSPPQDDGVVRSKSRYHRKRGNTGAGPQVNDQGRLGTSYGQDNAPLSHALEKSMSPPDRYVRPVTANAPPSRHANSRAGPQHERHASPPAHPGARDLRRQISETFDSGSERETSRRVTPLPAFSQISPNEPTGELFPPPRPVTPPPPRGDGPPKSDQIKATKSTTLLPRYDDDSDSEGGCFGLFKRKKDAASDAQMARPLSDHRPKYIIAGGGGVMPGSDAPVSAVNAGDRKVLVECGRSRMMFPVTPTTTCVDLIKSASTTMSERIDVKSAVILEHFGTVGIQRPLRRYESVRNVMNSWDHDRQNNLILVDPGTGRSESELSTAGAPKQRPAEAQWLLTYSQRPGKWEKRFITLKSDGQITCQKDLDKSRDQTNVCHLSDYDIYTPTQEKIKKKIKPPKKLCLAIKSQQKSSMFETTENFVHFFCSNDRRTADEFHDAVQSWRSWYLVNVLGDVKKTQTPDTTEKDGGISTSFTAHAHKKMDSTSSHYQLGSFKPLMDAEQIGRRPSQRQAPRAALVASADDKEAQLENNTAPTRRPSTRRQQLPAKTKLADDEPLVNLAKRTTAEERRPSDHSQPEEIAPTGLLGRSYSQRQREASARNQLSVADNNLTRQVSADGLRRQTSTRRNAAAARQGGDLGRSSSTRANQGPGGHKPLVDLTPQYPEPPQHNPKVPMGRGYQPDNIGPGGLIDAATSPEDPLGIPASTDWRGRNHAHTHELTKQRSNSRSGADHQRGLRPTASTRRPATARPSTARAAASHEGTGGGSAFTGEGLLAKSQEGWGGGTKGRGVIDGSRAKGPMVDFSGENVFAQGSLLNRVEREQGIGGGPVIER
jgi:hypothetical protein